MTEVKSKRGCGLVAYYMRRKVFLLSVELGHTGATVYDMEPFTLVHASSKAEVFRTICVRVRVTPVRDIRIWNLSEME